jgi:ubiquinone/menaquinone biosynthesis C-methylase UbiE
MDARCLEFTTGSFDKVLCIHVMDFVEENERVTDEILRVLKDEGQFVITYPSDKEGVSLGLNILKDIIRHNINPGRRRAIEFLKSLVQMLVWTVYLPLFLRSKKRSYSRHELQMMITVLTTGDLKIEEDPVYQDFIVYGIK